MAETTTKNHKKSHGTKTSFNQKFREKPQVIQQEAYNEEHRIQKPNEIPTGPNTTTNQTDTILPTKIRKSDLDRLIISRILEKMETKEN